MDKTEIFIQKAISKHGDTFDYSLVNYIGNKSKVNIICNVHGVFQQRPNDHLSGHGCRFCGRSKVNQKNVLGTAEFVKRANVVHNHRYNYDKLDYVNRSTSVIITCSIHGEFTQSPPVHLLGGNCPECTKIKLRENSTSNTEEFIAKAKKLHWTEYDYSKVTYINNRTIVTIICPTHGEFKQTPNAHLLGHGCSKCGDLSKLEHRFEYYKSTPTQFYVIKYKGLYKIGITTKTVDKRYAQEVSNTDEIETLFIKYFDNYKDAYTHEQCMLLLNTNYKYTGEPIFNNTGTSEVFTSLHKETFN